jgi:hypothetical protein
MRFDAVIDLVSITYTEDDLRQQIEIPTSRTVYANEFSVGATEFYAAGKAGLKPDRQYQLRSCDYEDEARAVVNGTEYDIVRANRRGEWVVLTMMRKVGTPAAPEEVS